ncbi:Chloroperoxidase [Cadophora sp. MPI-SDFR-AT-0126]|nr:Chloroperoxidase [Leotiomycetes sp. MPI-SDFR-AT-0126]
MRYSTVIVGALAFCASEVVAFPAAAIEYAARAEHDISARRDIEAAIAKLESQRRAPGFDAAKQYVSNQGEHAFVAPNAPNTPNGDQRGPCPGLNAMANHGYLPHNGVATIQQFIDGTYDVFGMGRDLGGFLGIYGALVDGNLQKWSIGGPTPAVPNVLGLLGTPTGISGSHNKYEGDASPTRPDLYEYGNTYKVIISQFQELFEQQPDAATANYDLSVLTPFRASRFQQSIERNPYFFNGPFSGIAVQPAAYTFIYRFMGNKSAEHPEGVLNQEVLKSFFSITGTSGNFQWTEGYERIPDNWYKRAIGDEYTIPFFLTDLLAAALEYPQFLNIGGNTGKVNTFTGIDFEDLTGGVFNLATLAEGNNLACFVLQGAVQFLPDSLLGAVGGVGALLGQLNGVLGGALSNLACPTLDQVNKDQFAQFPGAKGAY